MAARRGLYALLLTGCGGPFTVSDPPVVADSGDSPPAHDVDDTSGGDSGGDDSGGGDSPTPVAFDVCINEFMPDNAASAADAQGLYPDWIELHNPTTADVDLSNWSITDDRSSPRKAVLPEGTILPAGGFALWWADGVGADAAHLPFRLSADGGDVGLYTPDGQGSVVAYGAVAADFAVARRTDCCVGDDCFVFDFRGTPGASNEALVTESVRLFPAGSTWRYLDSAAAPGDTWPAVDFDDGAWASGPAPLGYGDTQATVLSYGDDPANKHVTAWFRAEVELADTASFLSFTLGLVRDDGAVVYVNGIEAGRSNMPEGEITASTLAASSVADAAETTWNGLTVDPALFHDGRNVLAVEVHQYQVDSSDLNFDLELSGERVVPE